MKVLILSAFLVLVTLPGFTQQLTKQFAIRGDDKYLNFPIMGWSSEFERDEKMMRIIHDGKVLDEFSINLAERDPDWWGFFPVEEYRGEKLTVEIDNPEAREGLSLVFSDSKFPGSEKLYRERYRQQVHFSNKRGWNNDPNGVIWYNGEWHLFFQYNPYGWNWGNMHWGHAVSKDLIHWQELPTALYSPDHDHMAFSGGAVVDPQNTTGFRRDGVDPLIATYTRTESGEHLALSYDNGRTFEEYEGNPVVEHRGRDPKVIWYEPGDHWVMIVYDESHFREDEKGAKARLYQHAIYKSNDMKEWEYQSGIPGFFECPELFQLPVEGEENNRKWVMYDADGKYIVGEFDGKSFMPEQGLTKYDYGGEFYASQTFSNVPQKDGRRIQIGWFKTSTPYMPFNQSMTFPKELKLRKTVRGYILAPTPIKELESLHKNTFQVRNQTLSDSTLSSPLRGDQLHIIAEFDKGGAIRFGININGFELAYNQFRSTLNDTFFPIENVFKLEVIVDRVGMEIFVNDGELYYAKEYNSVDTDHLVKVFAENGGELLVKNLEVHELKSIW